MGSSMGSLFSSFDASAAVRNSSRSLKPSSMIGSATFISFLVRVPVLSEQKISTPASSSIAVSRETMACRRARLTAPTAMVTESTAGSATGIAATVSTRAKRAISIIGSWRKSETMMISNTRAMVIRIRKLPI